MVSNQQTYHTSPQGSFYYHDNSNQASPGVYYQQQPLMYQPYQTYPMTAPQNTVFIYDDVSRRERNDAIGNGLMAALCASCLCCWILPPLPLHCHFWYGSVSRLNVTKWKKDITLSYTLLRVYSSKMWRTTHKTRTSRRSAGEIK